MTLSDLLQRASSDLGLLEPIGDVLIEKEDGMNDHEVVVLTLWIYIATNPAWSPPPVDRGELERSLRVVGEDGLADRLPCVLSPPNYEVAREVAKACACYVRAHASEFNFGNDLEIRAPDVDYPLPLERMAAIFRDAPQI